MYANRHSLRLFGILGAVFFAAAPASAQCTEQWLQGDGLPGLDDTVLAAAVYDDGTGPASVVGPARGIQQGLRVRVWPRINQGVVQRREKLTFSLHAAGCQVRCDIYNLVQLVLPKQAGRSLRTPQRNRNVMYS